MISKSPSHQRCRLCREEVVFNIIELKDVHKEYYLGEFTVHALRGVSFQMEAGDFVAIMGASGSGKSTFMNILGCMDRPTSGTYLLNGSAVSSLSKDELAQVRNQQLGFVFQGFNLLARTAAVENVELPMLYAGVSSKERTARANETLALVGLSGREHHLPSQLSGGQQQRVAIARGLVNRPALLLADEPTGNLDSRTSIEVMEILQRLNRERGVAILLITHEHDIGSYANRIVVFKDGKIIEDKRVDNHRDARLELAILDQTDPQAEEAKKR